MYIRPVLRRCHLTDIIHQKTKQANRMAAAKELEPQFGHLGKCDDEKDKEVRST